MVIPPLPWIVCARDDNLFDGEIFLSIQSKLPLAQLEAICLKMLQPVHTTLPETTAPRTALSLRECPPEGGRCSVITWGEGPTPHVKNLHERPGEIRQTPRYCHYTVCKKHLDATAR